MGPFFIPSRASAVTNVCIVLKERLFSRVVRLAAYYLYLYYNEVTGFWGCNSIIVTSFL